MITGTDEHGEKIAVSAANAGLEPKAHCDAVVQSYKHLWQQVRRRFPLHMPLFMPPRSACKSNPACCSLLLQLCSASS